MKVDKVLHMIGGDGVTSYAANSKLQGCGVRGVAPIHTGSGYWNTQSDTTCFNRWISEKVIVNARAMIKEAVKKAYTETEADQLVIADLGCSSGPNTFLFLSEIIRTISKHCRQISHGNMPEIQCFLNDLPGNDFNTLFEYLEQFRKQLQDEVGQMCYVAAVPGSFYGQLFPLQSVHFFHSSYCLMWLSQVPKRVDRGVVLNKGNIYISKASTPNIINSYYEQFNSDFSMFLNMRYKELVLGGRMILTFLGRKGLDAKSGELSCLWGLLSDALNSLVREGQLEEKKVDSFNLPYYAPSMEEVKELILKEGSFYIENLQIMVSNWDPSDDCTDDDAKSSNVKSGKNVSDCIRAVAEPILVTQFGHGIMDELFRRFALNVGNHLFKEKTKYVTFVVSLRK